MSVLPLSPQQLESRRSEALDAASFRILVEQIADYAIFMLDPDGRIMTWNLGAERIKGYRPGEVLGRRQLIFYSAEDQAAGKPQALLRQAERDGVARDIGWRIRKDGERFWADVTLTALHDNSGALTGFAKVTRDLTERVQAEERLRAYEAAKESLRLHDEFIAIAAHELRTPLTAGMLHLHAVQRQLARDPSYWNAERIRHGLELSRQNGLRLSQLIESLLAASRISDGRIELERSEFDLLEVVQMVIEHYRETAANAGCVLRLTRSQPVRGCWDRLRIEQILINLISNAIKYAPGSIIEVALALDDDHACLTVRDEGPGIAPEQQERIFSRFERAHSASSQTGLGLGLYVTRQIAELHGGHAYVRSTPGAGATFVIELPLG